jgi:hypothetical protein
MDESVLKEFARAHSDDIIYLKQAREALLLHPTTDILRQYAVAALVRQVCIASASLVDLLVNLCKRHESLLTASEALEKSKMSGKDEDIEVVRQAFADVGVKTDSQVFKDLFAIKELRNALVHHNWIAGPSNKPDRQWSRRELLADTFLRTVSPYRAVDLFFLGDA